MLSIRVDHYLHADEASERFQTAVLNRLEALKAQGDLLMSKITDFLAAQASFNASLSTSIDGLVQDVQTLNDKITALSTEVPTAADSQAMADLTAAGQALTDRAAALDAATPPPPPPPGP